MNCKKIKELILTDYIDNQMSDEDKIRLDIHFAHCHGCKEFFETVKRTLVEPFANAKKIEPPEFIWHRVKEAIIAKQQKKLSFVAGILEKLKFVFSIPKPALALSSGMVLFLIVMLTATLKFSDNETLENNGEEQAEYSTYSIDLPASALLNNDGGFGTSVEKYFL